MALGAPSPLGADTPNPVLSQPRWQSDCILTARSGRLVARNGRSALNPTSSLRPPLVVAEGGRSPFGPEGLLKTLATLQIAAQWRSEERWPMNRHPRKSSERS